MNSSIAKKLIMAVTGILFCLFLVFHLLNNLTLFAGPEVFNQLVASLEKIKPLIRIMEVVLLIIIVLHVINAIRLSVAAKRARPDAYVVKAQKQSSSFSSRTMGITGSILFIFLVTHLSTFWFNFQTTHEHDIYYELVTSGPIGFGNLFITILYMIAMVLLGFHLRHGFQSALQTFGIKHTPLGQAINSLAVIFWLIIPAGFFFIALWFGVLNRGHL